MNKRNSTANLLAEKKAEILEDWLEMQLEIPDLRLAQFSPADLRQQSARILDLFADLMCLDNWDLQDSEAAHYEMVYEILGELTDKRTGEGFSAAETAAYIFSLKDAVLLFLQDEYGDQPTLLNQEVVRVSRLVDRLGLMAFEIFIERSQQVISRQQQEIVELSTPVIQLWDGILAVPLIGTLDSARAQQVMENLLQAIAKTGFDIVILDIEGVSTVDTFIAQHLLKTVNAARLMGAECIISGIGPAIAQTIVQLGIDMLAVKTTSTLSGALRVAFKVLDLQVTPAKRRPGE